MFGQQSSHPVTRFYGRMFDECVLHTSPSSNISATLTGCLAGSDIPARKVPQHGCL